MLLTAGCGHICCDDCCETDHVICHVVSPPASFVRDWWDNYGVPITQLITCIFVIEQYMLNSAMFEHKKASEKS